MNRLAGERTNQWQVCHGSNCELCISDFYHNIAELQGAIPNYLTSSSQLHFLKVRKDDMSLGQ